MYNEGFGKRKILTDGRNTNKISIPLNLYSYFAAFKNNLHPNIKTNTIMRLEDDTNIIFKSGVAANSKVITKFRLWCPKIIFNGEEMKHYLADHLKPKKWAYLKEHKESIQTASTNSFFRISTGIRRPRHIFVLVVPTVNYSKQERNIFTFKTFDISANN